MTASYPTLLGIPGASLDDLDGATIVVFGAAEATPYDPGTPSHSAGAPAAIRAASQVLARQQGQHDFDTGLTMLPTKGDHRGLVDCGDVRTSATDAEANREVIARATARILAVGAVPLVLGGDDSVPIPVLAGYAEHGPVTVLQIDAHVDWADRVRNESMGYGSPMRRVSEMRHVTGMVQVGIRGLGSGDAWQHDDAREWGSALITARAFHADGVESVLRHIEPGAAVVIAIDCDGIDPATFPAVAMPTPGGLTYEDLADLFAGLAAKARIAGLVIAEYVPERDDPYRNCGLVAARIANMIMALVLGPAGQPPRPAS